ncbi:MAG: YggS family pyridoxal phosphate-dependent enzyme [Bacteroidia bacterium]|nr:YggS family pyridoxal phosphate-dependent enzyme [Bacteroidia bacterium]
MSARTKDVLTNILNVRKNIDETCRAVGRDPRHVRLLLATKTVPVNVIEQCILNGHTLFAENKVQELLGKVDSLSGLEYESHFIGHLQSNKVRQVIHHVKCIHSIDRLSLVKELNKRLTQHELTMKALVQVNTSGEESKFGIEPDRLASFLEEISHYPAIQIEGLMTIGFFSSSDDKVRPCFRLLRELSEQTDCSHYSNIRLQELSMGMSNDYVTAIQEGATIVRVGTSIFGQREHPDSYYWDEGPKAQDRHH